MGKTREETVVKTREENKTRVKTRVKTVEKIVDLISKNPLITVTELARKAGLSEKGIEWNIKKLKDIGVLKRIGPPRNGHWEIVQKPETLQQIGKETME